MTKPTQSAHQVRTRPTPDDLLDTWALAMLAEGQSRTTVKLRTGVVRRAAKVADEPVDQLTTDGLRRWLAAFTNAHTRSTYYRALLAWCAFLVDEGHRDDNPLRPIRRPRRPRCLPRPCPAVGLRRLLALSLTPGTRAAVVLAAFAGLRAAEISRLRAEDLDVAAGTLRVVGKGAVEAVVPLHPAVVEAAAAMPARGWWFPSPSIPGRPVLPGTVSRRVSLAMRRAGIPSGGVHTLRHLFATELLGGGANVREVQTLLRHSDLSSTQIYTAVTAHGLREAILRLPSPDGGWAA